MFSPILCVTGDCWAWCAHNTAPRPHAAAGQFTDVPAGDIGVGAREVGFMFGQYKRLRNEFVGILTGKGCVFTCPLFDVI